MTEQEARLLAEQIRREVPVLQVAVTRSGYPGYDETWHVKISVSRNGITSSTEIDDVHHWKQFKSTL